MATRKVNTTPAPQPEPVEAPIEIQAMVIALPKELADVESKLATLREEFANRVYDMTTAEGETACRKDRAALVRLRTTVEAIRVQAKRPILDAGKRLDAETSRVRVEIEALEDPRDAMIKALDTQRAEAKAERERIERERVEGIKAKIAAMDRRPMFGATATDIMNLILDLPMIIDPDKFQEFTEPAFDARDRAFEELTAAHTQAADFERRAAEMHAQVEAERAARLEAEERERVEREARERAEAEARAQEAARIEAEAAARREVEARERAEAEAEAATVAGASIVDDSATIRAFELMGEDQLMTDFDPSGEVMIHEIAGDGSGEALPEIAPAIEERRVPKFAMELHPGGPVAGKPLMILRPLADAQAQPQTAHSNFTSLEVMCAHLLDIATDCIPAESRVRLITTILRLNAHLWDTEGATDTGGGGGVDERKPVISLGGEQ